MQPVPLPAFKRRSLSPLPFLVGFAVAILAAVTAYWAAEFDRRGVRAHNVEHATDLANLQAAMTHGFIDRVAQSLNLVAYVRERDGLAFDLRALIAEGRLDTSGVVHFGFVDGEGIVRRATLPMGPTTVSVADRAHFRAVAIDGENFHIGRPIISRISGHLTLQIVRAVRTEADGFLGAATASIDVETFGRLLRVPGANATIALVGEDGAVRARSRVEPDFSATSEIAEPLLAQLRSAPTGIWADDRQTTIWRKIDAYPLYVTVTMPTAALTTDADWRVRLYWATAATMTLGAFFFALLYANRQARAGAALDAANAAAAAKTRLLASLGAELRRPVDVLRWSIDNLADPPDEATRRRALADLRRADAALGRAVNDAAELVRLMHENKEIDLRALDARAFARGAFDVARAQSGSVGVTCDLALDLPEGLRILADEARLRRVTDALLGQAFDRAGRGGRVGFSIGARGLDARNVEIAIAVSASNETDRAPAPEAGMAAELAVAMGGRIERMTSPTGTIDVFKAGFARAA